MSVMAAPKDLPLVDATTARWIPHRLFDIRSALERGPHLSNQDGATCPGDMLVDVDELAPSDDVHVAVECSHCSFAAGVKREVVVDTPLPLEGDERPDRWWDR